MAPSRCRGPRQAGEVTKVACSSRGACDANWALHQAGKWGDTVPTERTGWVRSPLFTSAKTQFYVNRGFR